MLSLRVEAIWFAIDLEDAWLVLRGCIHVPRYDLGSWTSVFEVDGMRVDGMRLMVSSSSRVEMRFL